VAVKYGNTKTRLCRRAPQDAKNGGGVELASIFAKFHEVLS
jgi:hypothetical protein